MFPDAAVSGGRLYFNTHDERYQSYEVPLSERARSVAERFLQNLDALLQQGFLPAAPEREACTRCAYLAVCGPHEAERTWKVKRADGARLQALARIRGLP
jgi:CRISPR/Cas system-associated exonuclease Cas4 (RecB family)